MAVTQTRQAYFVQRVLDTLLREDFCQMVSGGSVVSSGGVPFSEQRDDSREWLLFELDPSTVWWIPVTAARQLQVWRSSAPFVIEEKGSHTRPITDVQELIENISQHVDERTALFQEIVCALEHDELSLAEQKSWFGKLKGTSQSTFPTWWESLQYYDRLGSFLDHPYYPTARAKVGLDQQALERYAPEWGSSFELAWVSVPEEWLTVRQGTLPTWWPAPENIGLQARPGHILVPVHPHTLELIRLELPEGTQIAPRTAVKVLPTLSVRTMQLVEHPADHIKLPLYMRSLSYKNIRRIKPGTIIDGDRMEKLLTSIVNRDSRLTGNYLFTDESAGLSVQDRPDLGCILRRYPDEKLQGCTVLPTAALLAATPGGSTVIAELIANHFGGDALAFYRAYIEVTLRLHVTLWCVYGIALESNQQNTLLILDPAEPLSNSRIRLLLKDNDAARVYKPAALEQLTPDEAPLLDQLADPCIVVDKWLDIAQMFLTITLQLNLLPFFENAQGVEPAALYAMTAEILEREMAALPPELVRRSLIRDILLDSEMHYVKYLFSAGTLFSKQRTGAADINKHYGLTAPNCFR